MNYRTYKKILVTKSLGELFPLLKSDGDGVNGEFCDNLDTVEYNLKQDVFSFNGLGKTFSVTRELLDVRLGITDTPLFIGGVDRTGDKLYVLLLVPEYHLTVDGAYPMSVREGGQVYKPSQDAPAAE